MLSVVDNIETQLVVVRSDAGVAFVPAGAAALDVAHGALAAVHVTPALQFSLVFYRRRQTLSRSKEAAMAHIPQSVREHLRRNGE